MQFISTGLDAIYLYRCHLSGPAIICQDFQKCHLSGPADAIYLYRILDFDAIYLVRPMPFKCTATVAEDINGIA